MCTSNTRRTAFAERRTLSAGGALWTVLLTTVLLSTPHAATCAPVGIHEIANATSAAVVLETKNVISVEGVSEASNLTSATPAAMPPRARCAHAEVPFNRRVVNREYWAGDNCYRSYGEARVRATDKVIGVRAMYIHTYASAMEVSACPMRYAFHFRRRDQTPFMRVFGKVGWGNYNASSGESLEVFCDRIQKGEDLYPWGETRERFVKSVQRFVKEVMYVRDFRCKEADRERMLVGDMADYEKKTDKNYELDAIVNYMFTVAYEFFFCVQ